MSKKVVRRTIISLVTAGAGFPVVSLSSHHMLAS